MNVFALILVFGAIIAFEVPGLVKAKAWRELAVFGWILLIGMTYAFGYVLDIKLPNPTKAIEFVFQPPAKAIESLLK